LDEIGFSWDVHKAEWNEGFNYLNIYKNREGHCRVPRAYIENSFRLGTWVINQRAKRAALSDERRQRLNRLGFVWDLFGTLWESAFERLANYKTREGHCLVPIDYEENGFPLGDGCSGSDKTRRSQSSGSGG
jgi:hypothetical protein